MTISKDRKKKKNYQKKIEENSTYHYGNEFSIINLIKKIFRKIVSYYKNNKIAFYYFYLSVLIRFVFHFMPITSNGDLDQFKYHQMDLFYHGIGYWSENWSFAMPYPKLIYVIFYPFFVLTDLLGLQFPVRNVIRKALMAVAVELINSLNVFVFYEFAKRFFKSKVITHVTVLTFIFSPLMFIALAQWGGHYLIGDFLFNIALCCSMFYIFNKPVINNKFTLFLTVLAMALSINTHLKELVYYIYFMVFLFLWFIFDGSVRKKIFPVFISLFFVGALSLFLYWIPAHNVELLYLELTNNLMPNTKILFAPKFLWEYTRLGFSFSIIFFLYVIIRYIIEGNKQPKIIRVYMFLAFLFLLLFFYVNDPLGYYAMHFIVPVITGYAFSKMNFKYAYILLALLFIFFDSRFLLIMYQQNGVHGNRIYSSHRYK
ncbi:MAG: hypothetical protein PHV30_02910 [Candidatus Margulisbacteria bacterium]|nr:hypothetical protein [Candidatus Margulisiibacteriota bacterium]